MTNPGKLAGKVAIVTGGGGSIGGAISRAFAREGARVAVFDIDRKAARRVADGIVKAGGDALAVPVDVADVASVESAVSATVGHFGKLHILVNGAAARPSLHGTVVEQSLEDWNLMLAINLTGPFLMSKYAIPHLRKVTGASIINIASQQGHMGTPDRAAYCATKAALIHLTRIMAMDHAKDGIRVNSISPGAIDTANAAQTYGSRARSRDLRGHLYLMGRIGRTDEIAAGAVFLASDECQFMNAADLLIDGGYVACKGPWPKA